MMHLCRELFSTLLEQEGIFTNIYSKTHLDVEKVLNHMKKNEDLYDYSPDNSAHILLNKNQ